MRAAHFLKSIRDLAVVNAAGMELLMVFVTLLTALVYGLCWLRSRDGWPS